MHSAVKRKSYTLPPVNEREVLRYLGCRNGADETLMRLIKECDEESRTSFFSRVCYCVMPASSLLERFQESELVKLRLREKQTAVVFAATVGLEIDRLVLRYETLSPAKAVVMQALGAERIESLCEVFCKEMHTGARFSPGYGDFALQTQEWFFDALKISKNIGVTLNSSMLMTPTKSVTAIAPL